MVDRGRERNPSVASATEHRFHSGGTAFLHAIITIAECGSTGTSSRQSRNSTRADGASSVTGSGQSGRGERQAVNKQSPEPQPNATAVEKVFPCEFPLLLRDLCG